MIPWDRLRDNAARPMAVTIFGDETNYCTIWAGRVALVDVVGYRVSTNCLDK